MADRTEYFKAYYKKNKETIFKNNKDRTREYYRKNPHKKKIANKKYRDKKRKERNQKKV